MSQIPEILIISHKFPPSIGGMQKHCFELTEGLKKRARVHLLIQTSDISKLVFFFGVVAKAKRLLKENPSINLIYVNDGLMAFVLTRLLKDLRVPIVATIHGLDIVFPMSFFQRWIRKYLVKYAAVIAVSEATRTACLERGLPPETTFTVKNGFEPGVQRLAREEEIIQKLLDVHHVDVREKKVIISIGRGVKRKGFSWFIRNVFPRLDQDTVYLMVGPPANVRLITWLGKILPKSLFEKLVLFAGLATDEPEIEQTIADLGLANRVKRISGLNNLEVQQIIGLADLSVMPNLRVAGDFEGFGLVALEAAANGTLVVASGIEGITSAIEHNKNGILLESGQSDEWVRTIDYLLQNPAILASKTREFQQYTLTHSFSWDQMTDAYFAIFTDLVNKRK